MGDKFQSAHGELMPKLALVEPNEIVVLLREIGMQSRHCLEMFYCHDGDICWTHDEIIIQSIAIIADAMPMIAYDVMVMVFISLCMYTEVRS